MRRHDGFTLIEVMVALAIAALALGAVAAAVSQMADRAVAMQDRIYSSWIAQNLIAEMRLTNELPEVDETTGELEYAGLEWAWRSVVSETGVENLFRVDVEVRYAGTDDVIRTITGFIGEPAVIGESNRAWAIGTQAVGEDQ